MTTDEVGRLLLIEDRDGPAAAKAFAVRTLKQYRECLRKGHARFPHYRLGFIKSCLSFRTYIRTH